MTRTCPKLRFGGAFLRDLRQIRAEPRSSHKIHLLDMWAKAGASMFGAMKMLPPKAFAAVAELLEIAGDLSDDDLALLVSFARWLRKNPRTDVAVPAD